MTLAPEAVRSMFDRIAPVYDAMNRVMTAGLDVRWRRLTAEAAVRPGDRVLDAACGTGDLAVEALRAGGAVTGLDFSPAMLDAARTRFAGRPDVEIVDHNFNAALPDIGSFDVVVSAFAIHHCSHDRKRALYAEVFERLEPGGVFLNLEHVDSATPELHEAFLQAIAADEDPSNKLTAVETQLQWLREIGFEQVDCHWKWREMALLAGEKPA